MLGIMGIINKSMIKNIELKEEKELIHNSIIYKNIFLKRSTLDKFLDDKIFLETEDYLLSIEGVILNKAEILEKFKSNNWQKTIISILKTDHIFFNRFRGSFSGFVYDKKNKESIVFTNHIGDKTIFYYENNGELLFASEINTILKLMIKNNLEYTLNKKASYCLLTHGYMIEEITPFNEIKKIKAGSYLKIKNKKIKSIRYHMLNNKVNQALTNDNKIIDKIDELFHQAVKRQVLKNKEYGYKDIAPLSAGLDSRMTTYAALKHVKTRKLLNITYSQSNFLDDFIPKKISAKLKTNLLFKTLDNGLSLFLLDDVVKQNSGLVLYGGPAQVWDMFHLLDHKDTGIIHTGMLGDVVVGTFHKKIENNKNISITDGMYSNFLINKFKKEFKNYKIENYANQELFLFYNRGFNGANMGSPYTFRYFGESFSPFYDLDFLEFCLTIPVEKRLKNYIYDRWVIDKYPEASKYPHNGRKILADNGKSYNFLGKEFTLKEFKRKIINFSLKKIGLKKDTMNSINHMNPFDYWYNTNSELSSYMDSYYNDIIVKIEDSSLRKDLKNMYENGNTIDKTQVLTFLSLLKNYFISTGWLNE